ncbi:glycoside hydrolase family 127 protein [Algoriphagus sp. H41]|uniref:Glycoside hydrolase family 127 protein n=1 Tax=Algoriphagus oliviformis TaxID=2811231 RepID=A0ABS3C9X2_9BACT|nr:beta-L-arabinofuranosidase domain-containing protein [Algoriphagus oliviformis]MBN7813344.1 glycoside hydrolase family 127 protein [Algoriphagus oliviformis]
MQTVATNHLKTSQTPDQGRFLRWKNIPLGHSRWTDGFWSDQFEKACQVMVPYMGEVLCGEIGHALNNFKIAAGEKAGDHQGMYWHDGDFYKFMEAICHVYAVTQDPQLLEELDEYIRIIGKAQEPDGYIQTQIQLRPEVDRYENRKYHEMYNTGHLLISACVHYRVTGKRNFLELAIKQAELLCVLFLPESKHFGRFGFNQTQIMGLVELYRVTLEKKYLKLAEKFINNRGKYAVVHHSTTEGYPIGDMVQERVPLRESTEAVGHAVLALYYYAGAADVFAETGEKALLDALDRLWDNITQQKMYVTGAVGQAHYGASTNRDMIEEGFIDAYMLPNLTAYNETCANLCNAMFSYRMMGIHGKSKYADIIELVMFNSGLSGIGHSGKDYFYSNPLRMVNHTRDYHSHENATETPHREPYLSCFCCPPNLVRMISNLSNWAYSLTENGLAVNLYGGSRLESTLTDGSVIILEQETQYPWEGAVQVTLEKCREEVFDIHFRIPDWAEEATLTINGEPWHESPLPGNYLVINRRWKPGDRVFLNFPMEVSLVEGHPRVEEVRNHLALKRGPIVYCVESPDLPEGTSILDVYLDGNSPWRAEFEPGLLGGIGTLKGTLLLRKNNQTKLYGKVSRPEFESIESRLVPYYAWSNRGQAEMSVFLPVVWSNR